MSESGDRNSTTPELPLNVYLDERKLLIDEEREAARTLDKAMLTLSGGALGLSITFIKQIAPEPRLVGLLIGAWAGLAAALLATILGLHISQSAIRRTRDMLDDDRRGIKDALRRTNIPARLTNCLNWTAALTFMVGIALLAAFAVINLQTTKHGGSHGRSRYQDGTEWRRESKSTRSAQTSCRGANDSASTGGTTGIRATTDTVRRR